MVNTDIFGGSGVARMAVPSDVGRVRSCTFSDYRDLAGMGLARNLRVLGGDIFFGYSRLERVGLPDALGRVKPETFSNTTLGGIILPSDNGLAGVSRCTFCRSHRLASVAVPTYVADVPSGMFTRYDGRIAVRKTDNSCTRDCTGGGGLGFGTSLNDSSAGTAGTSGTDNGTTRGTRWLERVGLVSFSTLLGLVWLYGVENELGRCGEMSCHEWHEGL